jgi:hypothetical protein
MMRVSQHANQACRKGKNASWILTQAESNAAVVCSRVGAPVCEGAERRTL